MSKTPPRTKKLCAAALATGLLATGLGASFAISPAIRAKEPIGGSNPQSTVISKTWGIWEEDQRLSIEAVNKILQEDFRFHEPPATRVSDTLVERAVARAQAECEDFYQGDGDPHCSIVDIAAQVDDHPASGRQVITHLTRQDTYLWESEWLTHSPSTFTWNWPEGKQIPRSEVILTHKDGTTTTLADLYRSHISLGASEGLLIHALPRYVESAPTAETYTVTITWDSDGLTDTLTTDEHGRVTLPSDVPASMNNDHSICTLDGFTDTQGTQYQVGEVLSLHGNIELQPQIQCKSSPSRYLNKKVPIKFVKHGGETVELWSDVTGDQDTTHWSEITAPETSTPGNTWAVQGDTSRTVTPGESFAPWDELTFVEISPAPISGAFLTPIHFQKADGSTVDVETTRTENSITGISWEPITLPATSTPSGMWALKGDPSRTFTPGDTLTPWDELTFIEVAPTPDPADGDNDGSGSQGGSNNHDGSGNHDGSTDGNQGGGAVSESSGHETAGNSATAVKASDSLPFTGASGMLGVLGGIVTALGAGLGFIAHRKRQ